MWKKYPISSKLVHQLLFFFKYPHTHENLLLIIEEDLKSFYSVPISTPYYPPEFKLGFCYELKPYKIMAY